jgi:hypothetical protein
MILAALKVFQRADEEPAHPLLNFLYHHEHPCVRLILEFL